MRPFAGKRVVITSWALDGEAWLIGQQIADCLTAAGLHPLDARGKFSSMGGYRFEIEVGGPPDDLVKAIVSALQTESKLTVVSENEATSKMVLTAPDIRNEADVAAAIFVGTKPLPNMK